MSQKGSSLTGVLLALSLLTNGVLGVGIYVLSQEQELQPVAVAPEATPTPEPEVESEPETPPKKKEKLEDTEARLAALERVAAALDDADDPVANLSALLREPAESPNHYKFLRAAVLESLVVAGPRAAPALLEAIKDGQLTDDTRDEAAYALGDIRPAQLATLVRELDARQPEIRYRVALAIGRMKEDGATARPDLRLALEKEEDETVRFYLQQALEKVSP